MVQAERTNECKKKGEQMKRNILVLILLAISVVLVACRPSAGPTELETTEVREYKGENLSSINDFREN